MIKHLFLILLFCYPQLSFSAKPIPPEGIQPYGVDQYCDDFDCVDSLSKFKNLVEIKPSKNPKPLKEKINLNLADKTMKSRADIVFEGRPSVALIMIDNNEIVYQRYAKQITSTTPLLGFSMSKSLTSLAIGQAFCNGYIKDLDIPTKTIAPELNGTVYGESTTRQLLMMSSGGPRGTVRHGGTPINADVWNPNSPDLYWNVLNHLKKFSSPQSKGFIEKVKPGEEFSYKNFDTQALSFLFPIQGDSSFQDVFQKYVWDISGAEYSGYWIHDSKNRIHTPSSCHASPLDWAKVAVFVNESIKFDKSCFGDYIRKATTKQIENKIAEMGDEYFVGKNFKGYGYQFWTDLSGGRDGTIPIIMNGWRGQYIIFNPEKNKIMVAFSYEDRNLANLFRLFGSWIHDPQ